MKRKKRPFYICLLVLFQEMFSEGVIFAVTHLLTRCKSQYIIGIKFGKTATMFSQEWVPWGEKSEKLCRRRRFIFLTRNLTAVEFEPQCNAVLPRLRSDSYEAGQDRLWDPIENHLCGVSVGMENLCRERNRQNWMILHYNGCRDFPLLLWTGRAEGTVSDT